MITGLVFAFRAIALQAGSAKPARKPVFVAVGGGDKEEEEACKRLLDYTQQSSAEVEQWPDHAFVKVSNSHLGVVYGWLYPSDRDPAAVEIYPTGARWRFADTPNDPTFVWKPIERYKTPDYVLGMEAILRKVFAERFPQLAKAPPLPLRHLNKRASPG